MVPEFEKAKKLAKNSRTSVSAEVFGKYNSRGMYQPTVIKKAEAVKSK
jgi:hypothetical protein